MNVVLLQMVRVDLLISGQSCQSWRLEVQRHASGVRRITPVYVGENVAISL